MPPPRSNSAPALRQFANLWTLVDQPSPEHEWTLEEKFRHAREAGFDAMGGRAAPEIGPLCEAFGMEYICYADVDRSNYQDRLDAARAIGSARVNVQLCNHDTPPKEAVAVWLKAEQFAGKLGLELDLEVHRDTATETPEKVDAILEDSAP